MDTVGRAYQVLIVVEVLYKTVPLPVAMFREIATAMIVAVKRESMYRMLFILLGRLE